MAINTLGGQTGFGLRTTVSLVSTFAATVARGDFCQWHTTNWTVNSAADATNLENLGRIIKLRPNSGIATVEWLALHGPYAFTYSSTTNLTVGSSLETAGAGTSTVCGTSNATLGVSTNRIVATDTTNTLAYGVFR